MSAECRGIFVGGSGRSGTHAVAALLGAHSSIFAIPRELRFHAETHQNVGSLPNFLAGRANPTQVCEYMRGEMWFRRPAFDTSITRGLHKTVSGADLEKALAEFEQLAGGDRRSAARALLRGIADPLAQSCGKNRWVEMTPWNADAGAALLEMIPELRLIYTVRDGRDVACSLMRLPWGPGTIEQGLLSWASRLQSSERGLRAVPSEQVLAVHLERLVLTERDTSYRRILAFLGIEDEAAMRSMFDQEITAGAAHIGRWLVEIEEGRKREVNELYDRMLDDLARQGLRFVPPFEPLPRGFEGLGPAAQSTLDPWADGRAAGA